MTLATNIGVVIPAAGSSSRLGQPKQLLQFQNKTFLQRILDIAIPFNFTPSVLILGAHADQIRDDTHLDNITTIYNEHWPEGIASSIRLGVSESIKLNESLENILFLLSDQPFVTTELIEELIQKHTNGDQRITACRYKENIGVPAIFGKTFFTRLMDLKGDAGAKKIIARNREQVDSIVFKDGSFDVDTEEDYQELLDKEI